MAAKIASDLKKPDGMVEVIKDKLLDFLWPLDVSKIWGLGEKSKSALNNIGINTIGDLAKKDIRDLVRLFGKGGASFWQLANGIDERIVETESETKSISSEITFEEDTLDKDKTDGALVLLSEKVSGRMRQDGLKGRTITLKIRLEGFHTFTRSFTLGEPTNFVSSIYKEAKVLYNNFETNGKRVRLLGVKISNLSRKDAERTLFSTNSKNEREESVQTAIDKIKKKFGSDSIHLATGKAPKT